MKIKKNHILIIAIFVLVFFNIHQCSENNTLENQQKNTKNFLNDTISYYDNKLDQKVATNTTLIGDKNQLDILLSEKIDSLQQLNGLVKKYKKVAAAGNIITVTKIDTVYIPFDRPVEFDFSRKFKVDNPYYMISGRAHKSGLNIDNINIENQMSFVLGIRKNGWFKPKTYSIDVLNSNPFIQTIGADSYQFTEDIKKFGIGPYIGFDLFQQNISAGISLNYNLIQF